MQIIRVEATDPMPGSFEAFCEEQGCDHVWTNDRYLFANGAQWKDNNRHQGPPDTSGPSREELERGWVTRIKAPGEAPALSQGALQLVQLKLEFAAAKLKELRQKRNNLQSAVATQADYFARGAGENPNYCYPNWREQLATLDGQIEDLEQQERELTALLPRSDYLEQRAAAADRRRLEARQIISEVGQRSNDPLVRTL